MIQALGQAIIQQFNRTATIKSLLNGGLFFQQAPQDQTAPYGVFYFSGSSPDEYMGGVNDRIHNADIQFNLYSTSDDGGVEIAELMEEFIQDFDWQTLPMYGWNVIKCAHSNTGPLMYDNGVWQITLMYEIWFEKE